MIFHKNNKEPKSIICSLCKKEHEVYTNVEHPKPSILEDMSDKEKKNRLIVHDIFYGLDKLFVFTKAKLTMDIIDTNIEVNYLIWVRINHQDFINMTNNREAPEVYGFIVDNVLFYPNTENTEVKVKLYPDITSNSVTPELVINKSNNKEFEDDWIFGISKDKYLNLWEKYYHSIK
jgi:hypothetical protein